jgi:hypothetical protein
MGTPSPGERGTGKRVPSTQAVEQAALTLIQISLALSTVWNTVNLQSAALDTTSGSSGCAGGLASGFRRR